MTGPLTIKRALLLLIAALSFGVSGGSGQTTGSEEGTGTADDATSPGLPGMIEQDPQSEEETIEPPVWDLKATWTEGMAAYRSGNWTLAAHGFRQIAREQPSGMAWYNLGAALARLGETSLAAVAFERAVLADPRNPRIRRLYREAMNTLGIEADLEEPWRRAVFSLTPNGWALVLAGGAWVVLGTLALPGRRRLAWRMVLRWIGILAVLAAPAALWVWEMPLRSARPMSGDVRLLYAPATGSPEAPFRVRPRERLMIERGHGNFWRVRLPGDDPRRAWVDKHSVIPTLPLARYEIDPLVAPIDDTDESDAVN